MERLRRILSLAVLCAIPGWACDGHGAYAATTYGYDQRESFCRDMSVAIARLELQLAALRARGEVQAGAGDAGEIESRMADLRRRLSESAQATRAWWDGFEARFTAAIEDIERRLDDAS